MLDETRTVEILDEGREKLKKAQETSNFYGRVEEGVPLFSGYLDCTLHIELELYFQTTWWSVV